MQGIFDTHCHLMSDEYKDEEIALILEDAKFSGVKWFNNVGYDIESSKKAIQAANEFDFVYATIGIHPTDVARYGAEDLKDLDKLLNNNKVIAVGEIGLDYYHKHVSHDLQKEWFIKQLHLAKKHDLPVAIHCRDAYEECLHILKTEKITKGLMHCYSGDVETAKKFLDLGFYISFSGTVTFKNANQLREVAKMVPLDKILVETDAPYLTPDPYRGQKNCPKYIAYTVAQIAKIKYIPVSEMIRITTKNALKVFNIKE